MPSSAVPGPSKEAYSEKKKSENVPNVKTLPKPQLLELLDRQNKLISSKLLSHLPDKGEKVKLLKKEIEEEIQRRTKAEDLCDELTKLSIHEKKVEIIEWGDKANGVKCESLVDELEDEKNPLVLIATHSGTNQKHKIIKVEEPDEPLVTLADIEEAYALKLCDKIDKVEGKKKFLPHKTLKSTADGSKQHKIRDLSAATPPLPVFGDVKLITLEESIKIQYEQTQHLKEVQLKHATDRLRNSAFRMGDTLPIDGLHKYREYNAVESEEESEDENILDNDNAPAV